MARVFTDGAEAGDMLFWSVPNDGSNITTAPRSGARHYKAGSYNLPVGKSITALSEFYFRAGIRQETSFQASNYFIQWNNSTTALGGIRVNTTTKKMEAYTGSGTLVATGTTALSTATWYLLEVHVKIDDSPNGRIEVKLDGVQEIDFTGDTKPDANTTVDRLTAMYDSSQIYLDDLALNDTTGGADDSWCGEGKVVMISPNANGDSSQLVGSDGNSTDNYLLVDEVPPNSDTDYVESATAAQYDLYNLAALSPALGAGETIRRVWVEARVKETAAAGDNIQLGVKSSSTEDWSANIPVTTSYVRYVGKDLKTDPATSAAWTESGVNALQAGMKVI